MCDPLTLGLTALAGGAALFGGGKDDAPPPPPAAVPVIQPDKAREAGAQVLVGDGTKKATGSATPLYDGFTEKRATGRPLGGLGRGGLGL